MPFSLLGAGSRLAFVRALEAISHPWVGQDVARLARIGLDLFAQLVNEDAKRFHLLSVVRAPYRLEQPAMRQALPLVCNQLAQKLKLLGCQVNRAALRGDGAPLEINPQVG